MRSITSTLAFWGTLVCFSSVFGQSDSPCSGLGAPNLAVGTSCSFTPATTVGSTLQTNADNGGVPACDPFIFAPDSWFSFIVPASGAITISTQAGSITDGVMAVYSGTCGPPTNLTEVACNDDSPTSLMPEITLSGLNPGDTYFIRIWDLDGFSGTMDICITEITVTPPPTNINCSIPDPICSGSPIVFTAQANGTEAATIDPGNNYDCLSTSPNPSWYYLQIDTGGDLAIDITAGADVDFAIWGPYSDLADAVANCNSYPLPVDCSYSTSSIEQANVIGTLPGEVYVLLVTNFANSVQSITVSDAPSNTATTDCSIVVLPVELTRFSGVRQERIVELNWITATELNNDFFVVERSKDGVSWMAFDVVKGIGTTSSQSSYQSTDETPFDGISYYRLRQTDFNGGVKFSNIISVSNTGDLKVNLFPNPGKSHVNVRFDESYSSLVVTDVQGREVLHLSELNEKQRDLDVQSWKNGMYYITVTANSGISTQRLSIMK